MSKRKFGMAAALAAAMAVAFAGAGVAEAKAPPAARVALLHALAAEPLSAAVGATAPTARVVEASYWFAFPWYRYGCCGGWGGYGRWAGIAGRWSGYGGWGGYWGRWGGYGCCGGFGWGGWPVYRGNYYPGYYGDYYGPYAY